MPTMTSGQQRRANSSNTRRNAEAPPNQESAETVMIDESILSLLLKLHSALSGTLDSFSLDDHYEEEMEDDESDEEGELIFLVLSNLKLSVNKYFSWSFLAYNKSLRVPNR